MFNHCKRRAQRQVRAYVLRVHEIRHGLEEDNTALHALKEDIAYHKAEDDGFQAPPETYWYKAEAFLTACSLQAFDTRTEIRTHHVPSNKRKAKSANPRQA